MSWAANRGERHHQRCTKCSLAKAGCTKIWMRPRPLLSERLRRTAAELQGSALHCRAPRARRRVRLHPFVARARSDNISRAKTSSTSPSQTRASAATAASVRSPPAPSSWALIAGCGPRRCRRCGGRVGCTTARRTRSLRSEADAAGACRLLFSYRRLATASSRSESRRPRLGAMGTHRVTQK